MKYFEIYSPYYALIKSDTKENAIGVYVRCVADNDGTLYKEIKEVDRDSALVLFGRALTEDGHPVPISEVLKGFNSEENSVLIIDSSLL